jgi:hypothetical protein
MPLAVAVALFLFLFLFSHKPCRNQAAVIKATRYFVFCHAATRPCRHAVTLENVEGGRERVNSSVARWLAPLKVQRIKPHKPLVFATNHLTLPRPRATNAFFSSINMPFSTVRPAGMLDGSRVKQYCCKSRQILLGARFDAQQHPL